MVTGRAFGSGFGLAGLESGSGPAGIEDRIWMVVMIVVGLAIHLTYKATYISLSTQQFYLVLKRKKNVLCLIFLFFSV